MAVKVRLLLLFCLSAVQLVIADDCPEIMKKVVKKTADSIDWRKKEFTGTLNRVTDVKDTDDISHSYAYCAAALVESDYTKSDDKKAISFSVKQILGEAVNKDMESTLKYLKANSLKTYSKVEDKKKDKKDKKDSEDLNSITMTIGPFCSKSFKEEDIKRILSHKPACAELSLPKSILDNYRNEVYDCSDNQKYGGITTYHALVYGYDKTYYYIKPSRGLLWGKDGFAKLKNAKDCGIEKKISFTAIT